MNLVSINANAKVNFSIDVLGFAENGYHLVDMIMQTICVYDRIILYTPEAIPELREDIVSDIMTAKRKHDERIEVLKARGVPIRLPDPSDNIIFTCTNHRLPVDQKNLAYRAALLMKEIAGYKGKLGIHIRKNIPVGGGLGGGSADAAATLVGLNRLFGTELSTEKLMELGATLGSDVPFLVMGGTALATDTGTTLKPLPSLTNGYMLVVNPDIFLSTEKVYTKLDQMRLSPESHPDTQFLIEALRKNDVYSFAPNMKNVLERPAFELEPQIMMVKKRVQATNPLGVLMSGSGSTIFAIYDTREECHKAYRLFRGAQLFVIETDLSNKPSFFPE
ncbi:MAG: 4-(cytidine 5'-diphospho)-2-C-methyl-D-erythritol kinase [Clostridia bacterium]|nr:4-(cytidine 5'-diphospho)-2-C-methyl-D-erythritol kinase [Clostridia bacterium]